jgi:hypothetical protein
MPENDLSHAWSFLTVGPEERQHQGNDGYDDDPSRYYTWDSTVPNSQRPTEDDVCVVRDSRGVLGVSRIDEIETTEGIRKLRLRCRYCESTAFKARANMSPTYRCSRCFKAFNDPKKEQIVITRRRAEYSRSWRPVEGAVTAEQLEKFAYLSHSKQQAIRPVDPEALKRLMASRHILLGGEWWEGGVTIDPMEIPGGHRPQKAKARIGQDKFRRRLLERFGAVCAFTGPQPPESLHAAHVTPYAKAAKHDPAGGLLLRADLHSLFDRGLIKIDEQLKVRIDASLREYDELLSLDGIALRIESSDPLLPTLRELLRQQKKL